MVQTILIDMMTFDTIVKSEKLKINSIKSQSSSGTSLHRINLVQKNNTFQHIAVIAFNVLINKKSPLYTFTRINQKI